jgi:hypothetical protein
MLIPLETNNQRAVVTLSVTAEKPVKLGVIIYDPLNAHTHYLRRKIPFRDERNREILLPLPVTPEKALLEIYDKGNPSRGDKGFRVENISIDPLEAPNVWATPERHRYMEFVIDFARKAGYAEPGFYPSKKYEFLIHYVPRITDEKNNELVTPARIQKQMPRVQISQRLFRQFSIPVRIAILAHEGCHYFLNTRSEHEADLCGLRYYLDYGFPSIEAFYAASQVFLSHADTVGQGHIQRTKEIDEFITQYKNQKQTR